MHPRALTSLAAVALAAGSVQAAGAAGLAVTRLTSNAAVEPLGLDDRAPRLRWQLRGEARGIQQSAYQVFVASRAELAREGRADVWDSGRVDSGEPAVVYAGPALAPRTRYFWSLRVWATPGAMEARSETTWFETAFLDPSEWRAHWIAGPERSNLTNADEGRADDARIRDAGEFCRPPAWLTKGFAASRTPNDQGECRELRPAPLLRKSFGVTKPVRRARLYASGLAYDALTLNGVAVSPDVLEPGFTNYSRTVLYTVQDVTARMRKGENVIASELGSGQFDSSTRTWDWGWEQAEWRATPRLLLELHLDYADGSHAVVLSDASWRVSIDGPTRYDSYYLGETYDARREVAGWNQPGFDDRTWAHARVVAAPSGTLRAEAHEPIRVVDARPPGRRTEPVPGIVVYDVGQNLSGWAEVQVEAPAGTAVEIFYSEKLGPDGRASTAGNDLVYGQLQTDYYVAKGQGVERFTPRFTYKGFQYVQLSAPAGQPLPPGVTVALREVRHVRTSLERRSTFETTNATLARIHTSAQWAIQNNLHGIVTDTPVYEKNGWTGDAQLTSGSASLLFDTERLYRKLFQDMRDAQTEAGELSLLVPSSRNYGYVGKPYFKPVDCCGATPPWDAFWFVIPWESYVRHGDRRALVATYPVMRRYLDEWVPRWTGKDGDAYAHTLTSGLGDWLPPHGVPTLNALVSSAYYAFFARVAADAARVLGETADAARYDALFAAVRADFNARFLAADGVYREKPDEPFAQTAQILPLAFGLVPEEHRAPLLARLVQDVRVTRGGNSYVGVVGARYVLPVLSSAGEVETAFHAATQIDEPSWGYWTDVLGFTALGESWPADTRSRNHHMFGAIVQWLYEDLAGLRPLASGYAAIEFKPAIPPGLDGAAATYESVRGPVAARWRRDASGLQLDVTVPPTATGRVHVPAGDPAHVTEVGSGAVVADRASGVKRIGLENGRVVYEVGSGTYLFRVAASGRAAGNESP